MAVSVVMIILTSAIKTRIVCDLTEKCYLDGKRLIIYSEKKETCRSLDLLLWTWKQQSFIPHRYLENLSENQPEPVILTNKIDNIGSYDSLLLYDPLPVEQLQAFNLVIDFAEKYDTPALLESRTRYKTYRAQNYQIDSFPPGEFLHT
jgi:DNA polymerase-3 subunit chi